MPLVRVVGLWFEFFGFVTLAGGAYGYMKAGSRASLVAGGISWALLMGAGFYVTTVRFPSLVVGLLVSVALATRFGRAYAKSRKPMPAIPILLLALVSIVLAVAALASD